MPPDERGRTSPAAGEVYFEFIPSGSYVKVTAIDGATGIEASIVGAATATQAALERAALAKLNYVLSKRPR